MSQTTILLSVIIENLKEAQRQNYHFVNYDMSHFEKWADLEKCLEECHTYDYVATGAHEFYLENYSEEGYQTYLEEFETYYQTPEQSEPLSYDEWLYTDFADRHEENCEVMDEFTFMSFNEIETVIQELEEELEALKNPIEANNLYQFPNNYIVPGWYLIYKDGLLYGLNGEEFGDTYCPVELVDAEENIFSCGKYLYYAQTTLDGIEEIYLTVEIDQAE